MEGRRITGLVRKCRAAFLLALPALLVLTVCAVPARAAGGAKTTKDGLTVRFLDVGQGDSALITCDGESMLVDGGGASESSKLYSVLKKQGITQLRYIVATHPDADHIGGLPGALRCASCETLLTPTLTSDKAVFRKLTQKCREQKTTVRVPAEGEELSLGSAVIRILGPTDELPDDTNNNSIVFRLEYGDTSFLFTGDAEQLEQQLIMHNEYDELQADVVKMPHHGSSNAASTAFLNAVDPDYAVISCKKGNSYGHPHEETMELLKSHGTVVYRTDLQGDIVCTSDGKSVSFTTAKSTETDRYVSGSEFATAGTAGKKTGESASASAGTSAGAEGTAASKAQDYVVNRNTGKFHDPSCSSVKKMKESNKLPVRATREELIADGYSPCGNCRP